MFYRDVYGVKRIQLTFLICLSFLICTSVSASGENWPGVEVEKEISPEAYGIYKDFFREDKLELTGKLMTLFLKDEDKAYRFKATGDGQYLVQSRRTIQEGSIISVDRIDKEGFELSGELILKKGISFSSKFRVKSYFITEGQRVKAFSEIYYELPGIIKGINSACKFLTGNDFVAQKISGFLDGFYIVMANLHSLEMMEWRALSRDRDFLAQFHFPLDFTNEEIRDVEEIIEERSHQEVKEK